MSATIKLKFNQQIRQWRHELHQIPELAFEEHETSSYVAKKLRSFRGIDVVEGLGGTGIVGSLTLGTSQSVIALRADMDALPLTEQASHLPISRNEGRMHACGHDGHMAMVLGAAAILSEEGGFNGTIRFIFQPAEEPGHGAQAMVDGGLFEQFPVDSIFGLHNIPGLAAGTLHFNTGAVLASEDNFKIHIKGVGGHSSAPHHVVDPLVTAAEIVLALQTIVSRDVDPAQRAVVSCTEIITDGARNAIPSEVIIRGDTRAFTEETRNLLERRIREISTGVSNAYGATCEVSYTREFEPTINDADSVKAAIQTAIATIGHDNVDPASEPAMASEDFGVFAREVAGCFASIGNGTTPTGGGTPLHNNTYVFNDEILDIGVQYYVQLVRSILK